MSSSTCLADALLSHYLSSMSLAEIEKAVDALSREELTRLAAYIAQRDRLAWDQEIEEDFSPGGRHAKALEKIDAEIDSGDFTPLP
jgi:hypothetical protein